MYTRVFQGSPDSSLGLRSGITFPRNRIKGGWYQAAALVHVFTVGLMSPAGAQCWQYYGRGAACILASTSTHTMVNNCLLLQVTLRTWLGSASIVSPVVD